MKRKITVIISVIVLLTGFMHPAYNIGVYSENTDDYCVDVTINDELLVFDVAPFVENGRTLIPVRTVSEYLKYNVNWYENEQKVEISSGADNLTLFIGSMEYYKNGEAKTPDVPAKIKDGRTLVPLRLIAEEFGCEVEWNGELRLVSIIKYNVVGVKTPQELLENAKNYTKIILTESEYNLSELDNIIISNPAVYKEDAFDGYEYVIEGLFNFVIEGGRNDNSCINIESTYANVLSFKNCFNLTLKNITAGHKAEKGSCTGGVIYTEGCGGVNIDKCSLYGCGTYGISTYSTANMDVTDTEIYECSYGLVNLYVSSGIRFYNCIFRDSEEFSMFDINQCQDISVKNSVIKNNRSGEWSAFISTYESKNIEFIRCEFKDNLYTDFCSGQNVKFNECNLQ